MCLIYQKYTARGRDVRLWRLLLPEYFVRLSSIVLACSLLTLTFSCRAAPEPKTDAIIKESMSIGWDDEQYPALSKQKHEQGMATVRQDFINGKASGAGTIVTSSRSAMLDEAAVKALQRISLKSTGTPEQPDVKKYLVEVEFARDSVTNLGNKMCAELTGDIAYFKASQPGVELGKMRVYEMTLGMMVIGGKMSDMAYVQRVSRAMPSGFAATAAQCEQTPQALYLEVLAKEFKKVL